MNINIFITIKSIKNLINLIILLNTFKYKILKIK